ncbi:uncharacterized protein LOC136063176 [Quercus suber]|uniref:uncharacterized protein LOC136063176 n=1 Tax=Quercus suber TaxID=58331 RepID=UPI0032DF6F29
MRGIHAVEYVVTKNAGNAAGGVRFHNEIGSEYSKQINFDFCHKFHMEAVSLFINDMDGIAYASNNEINWNGNGQSTPRGLIEGIANYVRLKAGYLKTSNKLQGDDAENRQ